MGTRSDLTIVSNERVPDEAYIDALQGQQLPPDSAPGVDLTLRQLPPSTITVESGQDGKAEGQTDDGVQLFRPSTTGIKYERVMEVESSAVVSFRCDGALTDSPRTCSSRSQLPLSTQVRVD